MKVHFYLQKLTLITIQRVIEVCDALDPIQTVLQALISVPDKQVASKLHIKNYF